MLRFRLQQLFVPSLGRYLLPLPKLGAPQLELLSAHLQGRGFGVSQGGRQGKLSASRASQRISLDGRAGLASSSDDLLDAIAPAIPSLLASARGGAGDAGDDVSARYFSLKRSGASMELQLYPRLESLRTWTCLRRDGLCGLTPDEVVALRRVLGGTPRGSQVECVTARPREASVPLQFGRNVYYRSRLPVREFLSSLRTFDSGAGGSASYLPRDSVMALHSVKAEARLSAVELGEWFLLG